MKVFTTLLIVATIFLAGCESSNLQSHSYQNAELDVTLLKRYTWGEKPLAVLGVLTGGTFTDLEVQLKQEVGVVMKTKGYQYAESAGDAEFIVTLVAGASDQMSSSVHTVRRNELYYGATVVWSQTNETLQGGVSVVFKDLSDINILWQGTATQRIKPSSTRKKNSGRNVSELVAEIANFVPPSRY